MKAVVLAGGYATRLWPITRHRPKMFLPVGDTTVVDRIFAELEADDRIEEVYVSTNERFAEDFRTHIAESGFEKPRLSVEETTAEDEKFGVVGALGQLVEREGIDDDLLVVAGDNLIGFDLDEFVDFQEKPENPKSTLVSIACYAFRAEDLRFQEYLAGDNNPDEPGWYIQWLQDREAVYAFPFDDAWFDIGTPESYLEAVAWALDGENLIADSATLENVTLGENVHVMAGASVTDSSLDGSLVFPGATVRDCALQDSIVDEETLVENIDLAGALVGAHTQLTNGAE